MAEARYLVRGIEDAESALKVEAILHSKVGVHEVRAAEPAAVVDVASHSRQRLLR